MFIITEPTKLIILQRLFIDLSLQGEILCEERYKIKITTSIPCLSDASQVFECFLGDAKFRMV